MKRVTLTLGTLLFLCISLSAQVKSKFKDKKHKHQTVVIKESSDIDDQEILNTEFDIDKFKVGEIVRITTRHSEKGSKANKSKSFRKSQLKSSKRNSRKFAGRSLSFKPKKAKKAAVVFHEKSKKVKGNDVRNKCYKF